MERAVLTGPSFHTDQIASALKQIQWCWSKKEKLTELQLTYL